MFHFALASNGSGSNQRTVLRAGGWSVTLKSGRRLECVLGGSGIASNLNDCFWLSGKPAAYQAFRSR